jgi:hypothetical protein
MKKVVIPIVAAAVLVALLAALLVVLSRPSGRYQYAPLVGRTGVVIDTCTGQMWLWDPSGSVCMGTAWKPQLHAAQWSVKNPAVPLRAGGAAP